LGRTALLLTTIHLVFPPGAPAQAVHAGRGPEAAQESGPFGLRPAVVQSGTDKDGPLFPILPTLWWNDLSELTVGVWARLNFERSENRLTIALQRGFGGIEDATLGESVDFYAAIENPSILHAANLNESAAGWAREGTVGARVHIERAPRRESTSGLQSLGGDVVWVATRQSRYLDRNSWDNAGTVEGAVHLGWELPMRDVRVRLRGNVGGGVVYRSREAPSASGYDRDPFGRAFGDLVVGSTFAGFQLRARGYAGLYVGHDVPRQRAIPINGADPYETLANPFVRTVGAPLVGRDVFYHSPGHANLRGFRPGLGGRWALATNLEIERPLLTWNSGLLRSVSVVGFFDAAAVDTLAIRSVQGRSYKPISDGGGGVRMQFQVRNVAFPLRIEFPVYVSDPVWAHDRKQGQDYLEFRWLVSLQPIF
jgi:hypothetical protein